MLHIFLSNRHGDVCYGTSGRPVPGYELKIVADDGREVPQGEMGELVVKGPSSAVAYWNQRDKSVRTFRGEWTFTGDKYYVDPEGYFRYAGRGDDMLKVGGIWVSPFEVEVALIANDKVLEAAVVGHADAEGLIKPKAYVVLRNCRPSSRPSWRHTSTRAGSSSSRPCQRPPLARSSASNCGIRLIENFLPQLRWGRGG
jgi:4-hydroxybenzoate-CoA ligase/benzoate-CoA ligase